jgi:hypothetical protein
VDRLNSESISTVVSYHAEESFGDWRAKKVLEMHDVEALKLSRKEVVRHIWNESNHGHRVGDKPSGRRGYDAPRVTGTSVESSCERRDAAGGDGLFGACDDRIGGRKLLVWLKCRMRRSLVEDEGTGVVWRALDTLLAVEGSGSIVTTGERLCLTIAFVRSFLMFFSLYLVLFVVFMVCVVMWTKLSFLSIKRDARDNREESLNVSNIEVDQVGTLGKGHHGRLKELHVHLINAL